MILKKRKVKSIAKALSEKYGGKWKYQYPCDWFCDDKNRHVSRVATGTDFNGEYTGDSTLCMYYDDGTTPEWIYSL